MHAQVNTLIRVGIQLCNDWSKIHHKLLIEQDRVRKEQLLYKEILLERQFKQIVDDYYSYFIP